jgi:23S rRNA (pseudouridine1915-N3)-methyltransferase
VLFHIISVGKLEPNLRSVADHYFKMTSWKIEEKELVHKKLLPANDLPEFESNIIENELSKFSSTRVVLNPNGKNYDSLEFAKLINKFIHSAKDVSFIIGGAYGLHSKIINSADHNISLSHLTFPHQLAKVILVEQLYRAHSILQNHPYHK